MIKKTLAGGMNLIYLPSDKFKTNYLRINIYRPMGEESTKNSLLVRVLKSGCKKYNNKLALSRKLDSLYGAALLADSNKLGDVQVLSFGISLPADRYTKEDTTFIAAKLLREIVFCPDVCDGSFKENVVEIEKNNLKQLIESVYNDKKAYAEERCIETMFPGSPFAISEMGRISDLEDIDGKTLKNHYDEVISSSKIDIFISGNCNPDKIAEVFDSIKSADDMPENNMENDKTDLKTIMESQEVTQGKLMMGFKTDIEPTSDDYYKLLVFTSVYGSGTHSKLFCNVREKLSLAYYAYARLNRYKSIITVGAGIEFSNYEKTKAEVLLQFNEIKKGNVTDFELSSAKNSLAGIYKSMEDEPIRMVYSHIGSALLGKDISVDEIIERISAVTKEDVINMSDHVWLDSIYFLKGKENE